MSEIFECGIINTGAGNLTSLHQAILSIGLTAVIINDAEDFNKINFEKIVIPGQGRFGTVMNTLEQKGLSPLLQQWHQQQKSIFGICVGMQIFFEGSDEDKQSSGFGWMQGRAEALAFPKRPMVGWCAVDPVNTSETTAPTFIKTGNAYFVNSFAVRAAKFEIATTEYGEKFSSAVKKGNLIGVQFHPEKSSTYGLEVIKKCLDY